MDKDNQLHELKVRYTEVSAVYTDQIMVGDSISRMRELCQVLSLMDSEIKSLEAEIKKPHQTALGE